MANNLWKRWQDYTGNNCLSISGSVIISNSDPTQLLNLPAEDEHRLQAAVQQLRAQFAFLKIEYQARVTEAEIKIFAYQASTANSKFLDELNTALENLLKQILSQDAFAVRLNVFGEWQTTASKEKFHYLNKAAEVEYKITEKYERGGSARIFKRSVYVYTVVLIIILLFGLVFYQNRNTGGIKNIFRPEAPQGESL